MAGCLKSSWARDVGIGEVCFLSIGVAGALDVLWCRWLKNKLKCIITCPFFRDKSGSTTGYAGRGDTKGWVTTCGDSMDVHCCSKVGVNAC